MNPFRITVQMVNENGHFVAWQAFLVLDERAVVHPAPSDLVSDYSSLVVLSNGHYLRALESPEEIERQRNA